MLIWGFPSVSCARRKGGAKGKGWALTLFKSSSCVTPSEGAEYMGESTLVGCLVWGNSGPRSCNFFPFLLLQQSGVSCVLEVFGGAWVRIAALGACTCATPGANPTSCGEWTAVVDQQPFVPTKGTGVFHGVHKVARGRYWSCDDSTPPFFHSLFLITEKWHIGAPFNCLVKHSRQLLLGSKPTGGSKLQAEILLADLESCQQIASLFNASSFVPEMFLTLS